MEDYIKVKREVGNRKDEMWYAFLQDLKAGLCLTLGYLFKKKITMQYPYEKSTAEWSIPLRWRGLHALSADENGRLKCIMCLQCMKICPDHCIKIRFSGTGKERVLEEFTLDLGRCSACGLCPALRPTCRSSIQPWNAMPFGQPALHPQMPMRQQLRMEHDSYLRR